MKQYGSEFTIRAGRPSGAKTELTKIIEGWGDYFFYGFADPTEIYLAQWLIGSLNAFRLWHSRELCKIKGILRVRINRITIIRRIFMRSDGRRYLILLLREEAQNIAK